MRLLIPIFALLMACGQTKSTIETSPSLVQDGIIVVSGKVITKHFVNKAGKEYDWDEYYLVYDGQERFIRFSSSELGPDDLKPHIGKTLQFRIIEKNGLWDTDDPNVQSRVGDYVGVIEIVSR